MIVASASTAAAVLVVLVVFSTLAAGLMYAMDDFARLRDEHQIGAGEYRNEEDLPGLLPSAGLSATLTTESAAGASTPFDWNTAA